MKFPILFIFSLLFTMQALSQPVISIKKDTIGSSVITYRTTCYDTSSTNNFIFLNLHEDENTSVLAAKQALKTATYCLCQLQFKKKRFIDFMSGGKHFIVDPNRIFTAEGALLSLQQNNNYKDEEAINNAAVLVNRLAEKYVNDYVNGKKLVVALHNNSDGGELNIRAYKNGNQVKNTAEVYINPQKDADDFFLTTDKALFNFMKQKKFNVVLQNNKDVENDGSLSVYTGQKNIPYVNIEAQTGHIAEQKQMIAIVLDFIKEKNL